ncbi:hypothetical protein QZH41_007263 [Actinostola sp. cb2023]|nr:hypothetical protein QZH41_007263 [Actinostola sp. cb2023]
MNSTPERKDPLGRTVVLVTIETFFAVVITIVSLLGNSLVIYIIHKDSRLRSITNVFIKSLAWTDVCMAILIMPVWVLSVFNGRWVLNDATCPWAGIMSVSLGLGSIFSIGLIAVNRYFRVVRSTTYPKYFKSRRKAVVYCLIVWITAILLSSPPLYGWGVMQYHNEFSLCTLLWDVKHISYVVLIIGGAVNGTTIVICICYYKIYKTVKSSTANINAHNPNSTAGHTTDIKLLKTTFAVVCFFMLCWMPCSIVAMFETAGIVAPRVVFAFCVHVMFTSSCGNPIIYGILNPQFRRAFVCVFKCRSFRHDNDNAANNAQGLGNEVFAKEIQRESKRLVRQAENTVARYRGYSKDDSFRKYLLRAKISSSCGNPIIYGILNPQFRRAFVQVFKCRSFRHDIVSNNAQGFGIFTSDNDFAAHLLAMELKRQQRIIRKGMEIVHIDNNTNKPSDD